jgi:uncharacterized membrane protein YhaH (DUF805 family)
LETLDQLFSFDGRMRRRAWWLVRGVLLVLTAALFFGWAALMDKVAYNGAGGWMMLIFLIIGGLLCGVLIYLGLAADAKRLHDRNLSGWFTLIVFVPGFGPMFALVVMGCLDGTPGPNRFGPSEKHPERSAEVFA